MDTMQVYRGVLKIIPWFEITQIASVNQPAGGVAKIVSTNAGDTQQITIWGTRVGQGNTMFYEITNLDGLNHVTTTITDWNIIVGAFLGDHTGTISSLTAGNIRIENTAAGLIYTLAVGTWSIGAPLFYLSGSNVVVEIISGNTWLSLNGLADPNGASFYMVGKANISVKVIGAISIITDVDGAAAQILCLEG